MNRLQKRELRKDKNLIIELYSISLPIQLLFKISINLSIFAYYSMHLFDETMKIGLLC